MTWTIQHPKFHCMAKSLNYTVYKIGGKAMFTSHVCGNDTLDDADSKRLAEITQLLSASA